MRALIVLDMHDKFLKSQHSEEAKNKILAVGELFKKDNMPIILIEHEECGPIDEDIMELSEIIIKKETPSAFYKTSLQELLIKNNIDEIVVVGFNTEYCILFTSIIAFELGYKVHVIEDACGSVNDEVTYEMPGLDINDFIGSILNWSKVIEVLYFEEYLIYHAKNI